MWEQQEEEEEEEFLFQKMEVLHISKMSLEFYLNTWQIPSVCMVFATLMHKIHLVITEAISMKQYFTLGTCKYSIASHHCHTTSKLPTRRSLLPIAFSLGMFAFFSAKQTIYLTFETTNINFYLFNAV
jgi:hypothetical protein